VFFKQTYGTFTLPLGSFNQSYVPFNQPYDPLQKQNVLMLHYQIFDFFDKKEGKKAGSHIKAVSKLSLLKRRM
jgi:hypothetical protein